MMSSDRDLEFCSGGDEEDLEMDNVHSPTDASEDSVEVKVLPISPRNRNKRKCAEPRKVANESCTGPLKKRIRLHNNSMETSIGPNQSHFRPWSFSTSQMTSPVDYHPVFGYQNPTVHQEEPLSLVKSSDKIKIKEETDIEPKDRLSENSQDGFSDNNTQNSNEMNPQKIFRKNMKDKIRLPYKNILCKQFMEDKIAKNETTSCEDYSNVSFPYNSSNIHPAMRPSGLLQGSPGFSVESLLSAQSSVSDTSLNKHRTSTNHQKEQRNYKNMTRERRIEANARERTRVHTISAAFDTLRKSVPAYSHNQKLSKLSVLRIACSYILTLSRVAGYDYSADQSEPQLNDCVDLVSQTIQTEGKLRKKKDE